MIRILNYFIVTMSLLESDFYTILLNSVIYESKNKILFLNSTYFKGTDDVKVVSISHPHVPT